MADVKKTKINYTYYCTARNSDGEFIAGWDWLKKNIDSKFVHCWFSDNENDVKELPEFQNIATAHNFLYGAGLPFPCRRAFIDDFSLVHPYIKLTDDSILISYFEDVNILSFTLNICVEDVSCSDLVYLRQVFCDNPVFVFNKEHARVKPDGTAFEMAGNMGVGSWAAVASNTGLNEDGSLHVSVEKIFRSFMKMLGIEVSDLDQSYVAELNDLKDYQNVYELEEAEKNFIYGLMSGDEGWTFVPDEVVDKRLEVRWGSRDFVRFYNFGMGSVLINLNKSVSYNKYIERQNEFGGHFYGGINPYFLLDPVIAGVAHGIMFSLEIVLVIKAISNRIYAQQADYSRDTEVSLKKALKRTKNYRRELIITLRKVEKISISEMGELENMLLRVQQVESLIDKLKYLLELLESEIDLMYQESTNNLVNLLTIIGLCLSAVGVISGFLLN